MITSLTENWLRVKVTRDDIDYGRTGSPTRCAVARAVMRSLGLNKGVEVVAEAIYITANGKSYTATPPKKVDTFINKFDSNRSEVSPITFSIRPNRNW